MKMRDTAAELAIRSLYYVGLTLALTWASVVLGSIAFSLAVVSAGTVGASVFGLIFQSSPFVAPLLTAGVVLIAVRAHRRRITR